MSTGMPDGQPVSPARTALVTGATGYIGGLLVPALLDAGWSVRVLSRNAGRLNAEWADRVEVVEGDANDRSTLRAALGTTGDGRPLDVAYYLLHSMDGEGDFEERDRELAQGRRLDRPRERSPADRLSVRTAPGR